MPLFWKFLTYYLIALVLPVLAPNLFTYLFSYGTLLLILLSSVISTVYLATVGRNLSELSKGGGNLHTSDFAGQYCLQYVWYALLV